MLDFCQKNDIQHYKEASAKTNVGITEIFEKLIVELDEKKDKIAELTDAFTRNTFQLNHGETYKNGGPGKKTKSGCGC